MGRVAPGSDPCRDPDRRPRFNAKKSGPSGKRKRWMVLVGYASGSENRDPTFRLLYSTGWRAT